MKSSLLAASLVLVPLALPAIDSYDPNTGLVEMPSVRVDSAYYDVQLRLRPNGRCALERAAPIVLPDRFSMEWLAGRTLYAVWYGVGLDAQGNELDGDVVTVVRQDFQHNGRLIWTGVRNFGPTWDTAYAVDANGGLYTNLIQIFR